MVIAPLEAQRDYCNRLGEGSGDGDGQGQGQGQGQGYCLFLQAQGDYRNGQKGSIVELFGFGLFDSEDVYNSIIFYYLIVNIHF